MSNPVLDRARPLHEDPDIHSRRWFLLAMMCLSLVLVVMSVSGLVTAIPTMGRPRSAGEMPIDRANDRRRKRAKSRSP